MIILYWNCVWWFEHVRCFPHPAALRRLGTSGGRVASSNDESKGSWSSFSRFTLLRSMALQTNRYIYMYTYVIPPTTALYIWLCWLCWLCWCWFVCLSFISPGHFHDIKNERKLDENDELCPGHPLVARGLSASIRAKMECWIGRRWSKSSKRWDICCFAASLKQG